MGKGTTNRHSVIQLYTTMKLILLLLGLSTVLAQDWEYLKKAVDRSKFPLLHVDKFFEVPTLNR